MALTSVRLVDGSESFLLGGTGLNFRRDCIITKFSAPGPDYREQTKPRPDADGEDDTTRRHGARAVSVDLLLADTPGVLADQLRGWMRPTRRPWLYVTRDEWPNTRRIRLRGTPFSGDDTPSSHIQMPFQLQWKAPDGVWEAADQTEVAVAATGQARVGVKFPTTLPITFSATSGIGQTLHSNPGSAYSDQKVRMYGPCSGPRWSNDVTGETLAFTQDLVIPAGEYVEVDTRARTALYLSDPLADRIQLMDFEASTWWRIPPGLSRLRYHPTSAVDAGCAATATYRPTYL